MSGWYCLLSVLSQRCMAVCLSIEMPKPKVNLLIPTRIGIHGIRRKASRRIVLWFEHLDLASRKIVLWLVYMDLASRRIVLWFEHLDLASRRIVLWLVYLDLASLWTSARRSVQEGKSSTRERAEPHSCSRLLLHSHRRFRIWTPDQACMQIVWCVSSCTCCTRTSPCFHPGEHGSVSVISSVISASFSAEISVRSPRRLIIYII